MSIATSVVGGRRHTRQDRGGGESWNFFSSVPFPSLYPSIQPTHPPSCINISLPPSLSVESRLHPPSFAGALVHAQFSRWPTVRLCGGLSFSLLSLSLHSRVNFLPILSAFTGGKSTFLCSIYIPVHYLASWRHFRLCAPAIFEKKRKFFLLALPPETFRHYRVHATFLSCWIRFFQ